MRLSRYQSEIRACLRHAATLLGGDAVAAPIDWEVQSLLWPRLTLEVRAGLDGGSPVLRIDDSPRGHEVWMGIERYRVTTHVGALRIARIDTPYSCKPRGFWAVRAREYRTFYRYVRRLVRQSWRQDPPVMLDDERNRLWNHTIGFLRRARDVLRRFGIAARRGVLLQGSPGNGKTMACRWLRAQCRRHGLSWDSIQPNEFEEAHDEHRVNELLQPERPGLLLLDDFDSLLRQRGEGHTPQQTALLAALDGVAAKTPAVYLFASNLRIDEINPAVRRPGRIDVILQFDAPDSTLRRRLIVERWPGELLAAIDIERVVTDSVGWSFAELEEARKLLVLHFAETGQWSWVQAGAAMRQRRDACAPKRPIGFGAIAAVNNEDTPCVVAKTRC